MLSKITKMLTPEICCLESPKALHTVEAFNHERRDRDRGGGDFSEIRCCMSASGEHFRIRPPVRVPFRWMPVSLMKSQFVTAAGHEPKVLDFSSVKALLPDPESVKNAAVKIGESWVAVRRFMDQRLCSFRVSRSSHLLSWRDSQEFPGSTALFHTKLPRDGHGVANTTQTTRIDVLCSHALFSHPAHFCWR